MKRELVTSYRLSPHSRCSSLRTPPSGRANRFSVELNKLEPNEGDCRAYLVLENKSASAFESLKLDVVVFDTDGIVAKRLAVEAAPLPLGKTSLKVFDIGGLACDRVGRVLLNEVMTCADDAEERGDCLELMSTSSRATISFIK